jgi:hypothetical protein
MDFLNFSPTTSSSPAFFQHVGACRADEGDAVVEEDVNQDDDAADITSQVTKAVMSTDCQALEKQHVDGCHHWRLELEGGARNSSKGVHAPGN